MRAGWPVPLRRQAQTLVNQFPAGTGEAWIGIAGIECLGLVGRFPNPRRLGGRLEALAETPLSHAFVWVQGSEPESWVDPLAKDWRTPFDRFARQCLGLPGRPDGQVCNIDHVFPKVRAALDGLSHVRMLAIGAAGNQDAGWSIETAMKARADPAAGGEPSAQLVRHATWMSIGKLAGFVGWEALPDDWPSTANAQQIAALFAHLAARGIVPPAGAEELRLSAHSLARIR